MSSDLTKSGDENNTKETEELQTIKLEITSNQEVKKTSIPIKINPLVFSDGTFIPSYSDYLTTTALIQSMVTPIMIQNTNISEDNPKKRKRHLSNDEKRQLRLLRNRVAAKECRKKKKQHIQDMELKINELETENQRLINQIKDLKQKLALQEPDGYRLMKQVEELNAKLGPLSNIIQQDYSSDNHSSLQ